jgi:voltage-gated potassium channel
MEVQSQAQHGKSGEARDARRANWAILKNLGWQLIAAGALLFGCGFVYWWIEPHAATLADGLWLAFVTASTVGFGDVVPSTPASRLFSVVVVLLGFAVLSLVTAAIAAALVGTQERRIEREILRDMHQQLRRVHEELASLRQELRRPGNDAP